MAIAQTSNGRVDAQNAKETQRKENVTQPENTPDASQAPQETPPVNPSLITRLAEEKNA